MSDTEDSRAGSQFGHYHLRRLLGRGGMGDVYEAEDTVKERVVALKLMSAAFSGDPVFRKRMQREARTAGRLQEPHVVPIHDFGEIDGQLYVDMRLIEGIDVAAVLSRYGPLAPPRAVAIIRQIASALDAAHAAGVMHRDVKPENILITHDDFAYLVDFGIASATTDEKLTQMGSAIGTFRYMAPERFTNSEVTYRADVYALACVLYECLTGSPPYRGNDVTLMTAHLTQSIPRASALRPGLPVALDQVIERGMAKNPEDRHATAGDLALAAHQALATPEQDRAADILHRSQVATLPPAALTAQPPTLFAQPPSRPVTPRPAPTPQPVPSVPTFYAHPQAPGGPVQPQGGWTPGTPPHPPAGPHQPPSQPVPVVTPPRRRRRTGLIAALVAVLVLAAGGVGGWLLLRDSGNDGPRPVGAIEGAPIPVGKEPLDIVAGDDGALWTANIGDGTISKIDPATGTATNINVGGSPTQLAVTSDAVWVWNYSNSVTRVDIASESVGDPIDTGPGLISAITAGKGYVWLTNSEQNTVIRIDPETQTVTGEPIKVGLQPMSLVVGADFVYVVNQGDETISTVDTTGPVGDPLPLNGKPGGIEFHDGTLYVFVSGNITPIDEATFAMGEPVPLMGACCATAGHDGIWAAFPVTDELRWFDLKGMESKGSAIQGIGKGVGEVLVFDGTVWLTDSEDSEVLRITPR
jgi:serine/threonine protein kinase/DNA-binding beta-propeller fold protein YncE